MKAYLLQNWSLVLTAITVCVLLALGGCTFMKERPATAKLAVTIAVGKYIDAADRPAERAQRVRDVAGKVLAYANATETVTVDLLKVVAINNLPANLSPTDRLLAGAIIDVVVEELKARIADGKIPPDQLVTVRNVVQWVSDATAAYLPQP